jgi:hypothetical protein
MSKERYSSNLSKKTPLETTLSIYRSGGPGPNSTSHANVTNRSQIYEPSFMKTSMNFNSTSKDFAKRVGKK